VNIFDAVKHAQTKNIDVSEKFNRVSL